MLKIYHLLYRMEIPYELLIRYCQNNITSDEKLEVEKWLSEGDNASLFSELKSEWNYIDDQSLVLPDKNHIWGEVKKEISKTKTKNKQLKLYKYISVAAAVLLLITSGSIFYIFNQDKNLDTPSLAQQYTTISTKAKEKTKIDLADGSEVWLNSNSNVTFGNLFNVDTREISVNGELFLDVSKSDKKFIVNAGSVKVEVLGTAFNIKVFDDKVDIALQRGKIAVVDTKTDKRIFVMDSAQNAVINKKDLQYTIETENNLLSNIWKEESLTMHDETLDNIIMKLEIWYNLKITHSGLDSSKRYSFFLENESIHDFLELFSAITPINYSLEGNKLNIKAA